LADVLVAVFETGAGARQAVCEAQRSALLRVAMTALNCVEASIRDAERWFLVSSDGESQEHHNKEIVSRVALWDRWWEMTRRWQAA
jgi:Tfp pilus assembly protein PilX